MMRYLLSVVFGLAAAPAFAASGPFVSLQNTNFVVLLAFLVFVGVLIYFKVPGMVGGLLDKRAAAIRGELDEARALREEAQALLASYERKQKDVQAQADRIVATARDEAAKAAVLAKDEIRASVARRLASAEDQIASAQAAAIRDVRDRAITVAVRAAQDVIAAQMTAAQGNKLIDDAISEVEAKLH
ncbi:MAG: F0F1 ATP synthase subunit B [Rhodobacterales bacterium]|nr:F0F1 ATP synthase subunit B [Rhodobacterales bacterium]NCT12161.1 F0F1 ATP synthase subunit B [Rhodobacterales bacterium]